MFKSAAHLINKCVCLCVDGALCGCVSVESAAGVWYANAAEGT